MLRASLLLSLTSLRRSSSASPARRGGVVCAATEFVAAEEQVSRPIFLDAWPFSIHYVLKGGIWGMKLSQNQSVILSLDGDAIFAP